MPILMGCTEIRRLLTLYLLRAVPDYHHIFGLYCFFCFKVTDQDCSLEYGGRKIATDNCCRELFSHY